MYPLTPARVYMLQEVEDDERSMRRMEHMLDAIDISADEVITFTADDLPDVFADMYSAWSPQADDGSRADTFSRPLVFTRLQLGAQPPDLSSVAEDCPDWVGPGPVNDILGYIDPVRQYHEREDDWEKNFVCWPTNDFGVMSGCPHGCLYCGAGKSGRFIAVGLNIEEYMEQVVGPTIQGNQWQKCFRMIGWAADIIAFEPEYGCFDLYTRKLAGCDRWGYFHTTSPNVDWIAELPHRDRLVGVWSTTCSTVAEKIEPGAGGATDRIDAARTVQDMGLPVRYKFKPMIPVRGWREDYAEIIEYALRNTQPESIGFCVIMWMDFDALAARLDLDLLDGDFVEAARAAADDLEGVVTGPFPCPVRAEIYRHLIQQVRRFDEDVPLYISTESREMWQELADDLGQSPDRYVCGCSSVAVPGGGLALSPDCPHSTFKPIEDGART